MAASLEGVEGAVDEVLVGWVLLGHFEADGMRFSL